MCAAATHTSTFPCPAPAEEDNLPPPYTAQVSGNTFWLNISNVTQAEAQESCMANGGHLALYLNEPEQREVEQVGGGAAGSQVPAAPHCTSTSPIRR
jgi:hypothetical protein